jgi:hypothetical protein
MRVQKMEDARREKDRENQVYRNVGQQEGEGD